MVAGDSDVGVHGLKELQEDTLSQRSHSVCASGARDVCARGRVRVR